MDVRFQWFVKEILDWVKLFPRWHGDVVISFQSGKPCHIKFNVTKKYEGE